ncbi:MAG TPA: metallophosphoesterase [Thermoanaerobaculia bacterium]|nr:metallophosphoesterase [Thermoanaerobaculia bacterium]
MPARDTVRIAAVGDIHTKKNAQGPFLEMFRDMTERADVALLCGDLTDYGTPEEAEVLAHDIKSALRIPALGVLGNHDFETGQQDELVRIMTAAGVVMLDGDAHEVHGIGFAGAKGFVGGFGRRQLGSWGEPSIKALVHESVEEVLKLEAALAKLRTPQKVAVLHYAPIPGTVEGEPPELIPFLGSSRLEDPIERYRVSVVFHGHAHHGSPEGRTRGNVPVFNVAMPLLKRMFPDRLPYKLFEIPVGVESPVA